VKKLGFLCFMHLGNGAAESPDRHGFAPSLFMSAAPSLPMRMFSRSRSRLDHEVAHSTPPLAGERMAARLVFE